MTGPPRTTEYEPGELERKWRTRWEEQGRYEADPEDDGEPTFITVPYPYPSGGMHIGHVRTFTVPDVYARYRRLQGDNVLFPLGWHVTGTPIVGAVERLKEGEEEQLSVLQDTYNVPEDELQELETPMGYARYFIENHYKKGFEQLGLSIDWRREFTTNDERYSKFITWQYETLKERGLLEKGLNPVNYCTNEQQPVTTHDLLEGEDAEYQEFTLVKFGAEIGGEDVVAPMATLRPETVRGVTNAYLNPDAEYVLAEVDGETWFVSKDAAEKFDLQAREVEVLEEVDPADVIGETAENPVTGDEVLILPADFVDADNATGVVMSVPAHSPDDYVALQEAKADDERMREYGIDPEAVAAIEPVPILKIEGYGEIPARDAVQSAGIDSSDDPQLEDVTAGLYQDEFHSGRLLASYGEFAGEVIEDVRERFREHYSEQALFDTMYEFTEEVVCRCGGDVEVAQKETWFLRYSDQEWSRKAHEVVDQLEAIPKSTADQYDHTIDWLEEWPCIRNYGLGTRLPWDDEFVIEPLSDSTIYMAYYTIAHRLEDVPPEEMDRDFFDTLFYGPDGGDAPAGVEVDVEEPSETALELREEWEHWYPVDFRCSGNDLIQNHLTFYLFHHAELFDRDNWPQGITVMGMGLLEGKKMSSSKGHVVLPDEAIGEYGADTVRFFLLNSSEPWQDFDWRADQVATTRDQLERFWTRAQDVIETDVPDDARDDLKHIDRWLLAKLQATIREATESMERFETRSASQAVFYQFDEHLTWYRRRTDTDRPGAKWTLREVLGTRLRLLAPFAPFMTNELHEQLEGEAAEDAGWPEPNPEFESIRTEVEERLVADVTDDVADIVEVTDTDPETIRLYVAADWKHTVFEEVVDTGPDVGAVMGNVMQYESLRRKGDAVNDLAQGMVRLVRERDDETLQAMLGIDEQSVYESARSFLAREFDAEVEIYAEDGDPHDPAGKAGQAEPFRPAVHLE
ncbi:leucine--tRNA ligase [Halapricum desulfuricans]|uniref:Leucine--tRNA ligase n=1 Tax=Halapricum desulfuricans TaxID=2841257 RepID=A0A897N6G5_9EURY|nr:leucine--tRNA ligase [Halapricum desulfuricans]QSG08051.1 Leucyl-tRNA synthetase [Halapricum desulfuricans]